MTKPDEIEFREPVRTTGGRSPAVRVGIVAGSALLIPLVASAISSRVRVVLYETSVRIAAADSQA